MRKVEPINNGQGALEYLLLIGGAILVVAVVLVILLTGTQDQNDLIPSAIGNYNQTTQDAAGLSGGGNGPPGPTCGDGSVNQASEQCDDGGTANGDGCSSSCQIETPAQLCGNTIIEGTEQCEGTDFGPTYGNGVDQCDEYYSGGYAGGNLTCDPVSCTVLSTDCLPLPPPPTCGDGALNQPGIEECDGSDFGALGNGAGQCPAYASVYADGDLLCTNTCHIDSSACVLPVCGDGLQNGSEVCDGSLGCALNDVCSATCNQCISPPTLASFTGDWYDAETQLFFSAIPSAGGTLNYTLARGGNLSQIQNLVASDFTSPPAGVTLLTVPANATAQLDTPLNNGTTYHYALRVCESGSGLCSYSSAVVSLTPHVPTISFTLGSTDVVFDYTTDKCGTDGLDVPDNTMTAVHIGNQIILDAANAPTVYFRRGTSFNNLTSDCAHKSLISTQDTQAANSNNFEWVNSIYSKAGKIYALIHQEFHDTFNAAICGSTSPAPDNPCWYNTITAATSSNNGNSFTQLSPSPNHIVADPPLPWNASTMKKIPYGYMTPTNIISRVEGGTTYYYAYFIAQTGVGSQTGTSGGVCLMRTTNLDDPTSWYAYSGMVGTTPQFTIPMSHPYSGTTPQATGEPNCTFINQSALGTITGHVTFNTYLQQYMMVGIGAKHEFPGALQPKCGFWYSTSKDLINWSWHKIFFEGKFPFANPFCKTNVPMIAYGSMIDEDQLSDPTDPNFEKSDETFELYYTVFNNFTSTPLDRDLVRRPVTITKT